MSDFALQLNLLRLNRLERFVVFGFEQLVK